MKIIKNPALVKEKMEWFIRNRLLVRFYARKVLTAYNNPDGDVSRQIKEQFAIYRGLRQGDRRRAERFLKNMDAGQQYLYSRGHRVDFDPCSTGFLDVKMLCASDSVLEAQTALFGAYAELTILDLYKKLLNQNSVAVDVGANVGFHSLPMAKIIGGIGPRVFAYEPRASLAGRLKKNLEANGINSVNIRNVGVWDKSGKIGFDENDGYNQGVGSCNPKSSFQIDVVSLDDDLSGVDGKIDVIKIDVEGGELQVIKGARKILTKHKPGLILEYNDPVCRKWTLRELKQEIPYPVKVYRIPDTFHEELVEVADEDALKGWNNLLLKPY